MESLKKEKNDYLIVVIGRFIRMSGYSYVAKTTCEAIRSAGFPLLMVDIDTNDIVGPACKSLVSFRKQADKVVIRSTNNQTRVIALFIDTPNRYPQLDFEGRVRRIGYHFFETDSYPAKWFNDAVEMDEIWTASQFNKETFVNGGIPNYLVSVIPLCINSKIYSNHFTKMNIPEAKNFKFLSVFSNFNRKDVGLLLRSYFSSFSHNDKVSLIIKYSNRINEKYGKEYFQNVIAPDFNLDDEKLPHIVFLKDDYNDERMKSLYSSCDAYVAIDRGTGWDLPAMESMILGKAVIGINWSAHTQFMTEQTTFLVEPEKENVPVDGHLVENISMYTGHKWAYANDKDMGNAMRTVYDNQDLREQKGENASCWIKEQFDISVIGKMIEERFLSYQEHDFYLDKPGIIILHSKLLKVTGRVNKSNNPQKGKGNISFRMKSALQFLFEKPRTKKFIRHFIILVIKLVRVLLQIIKSKIVSKSSVIVSLLLTSSSVDFFSVSSGNFLISSEMFSISKNNLLLSVPSRIDFLSNAI